VPEEQRLYERGVRKFQEGTSILPLPVPYFYSLSIYLSNVLVLQQKLKLKKFISKRE